MNGHQEISYKNVHLKVSYMACIVSSMKPSASSYLVLKIVKLFKLPFKISPFHFGKFSILMDLKKSEDNIF